MILWRISNYATLDGIGGLKASGRWHSRGRRVVYCARSPSAALLEMLAHLDLEIADLPAHFVLLKIRTPTATRAERVSSHRLGEQWRENRTVTQAIGDEWLRSNRTALLDVPSALVPETRQALINPAHPDAARFTIISVGRHELDSRLVRQDAPGTTTPRSDPRPPGRGRSAPSSRIRRKAR